MAEENNTKGIASSASSAVHASDSCSSITPSKAMPPIRCSWNQTISNTWAFEILSMGFSVANLFAIVAVLRAYDGTTLRPMPYGLTLNAIISTLATASKTALICAVAGSMSQLKWCLFQKDRKLYDLQMFDDASRGPAGSVSLLWKRTRKTWAALGAAVILLALVFDPFIQQILAYHTRTVRHSSRAANTKKASTFGVSPFSYSLVSAINAGIWSDASQFHHAPTCASGNCDWLPFTAFSWCSKCHDVTSLGKLEGDCDLSVSAFESNGTCKVVFEDGMSVTVIEPNPRNAYRGRLFTLNAVQEVFPWSKWFTYYNDHPEHMTYDPPIVLRSTKLDFDMDSKPLRLVQNPRISVAEQCELTPCLRDYKLQVSAGHALPNVDSTQYGMIEYMKFGADFPTLCWKPNAENASYSLDDLKGCDASDIAHGTCRNWFNRTRGAFCKMEHFGYQVSEALVGATQSLALLDKAQGQNMYGLALTTYSNEAMKAIHSHNLSYVTGNIAASLTSLALEVSDERAFGYIERPESFVSVRWVWISLPVILECLGLTLFVLTALRTRRERFSTLR